MTKPTERTAEIPAALSHELRNAVACIHQFGNILLEGLAGELSGEQREYIGIMLENASKIRRVLDSSRDGARGAVEEGRNKIEGVSKLEI